MNIERFWRTCIHEAGHAFVALHVGERFRSVWVDPEAAEVAEAAGIIELYRRGLFRSDGLIPMPRIIVCMAGRAAELEVLGDCFESGIASDTDQVYAYICNRRIDARWRGVCDNDPFCQALLDYATERAVETVRLGRAAVEAIASELKEELVLNESEVRALARLVAFRRPQIAS